MSSKKRVSHGFSCYQFPVIPKAPRSVRGRRSHENVDNDEICAFELLAAVAGELLQESESSACSNAAVGKDELVDFREVIKREQLKDDKAMKSESFDQGSCVESAYIPEPLAQEQNLTSTVLDSGFSNCKEVNVDGKFNTELEGGSSNLEDAYDKRIESGTRKQLDDDSEQTEDLTVAKSCKHVNNNSVINSDSSVQLPSYRAVPRPSFGKQRNNVKLGIRDDDENSFVSYRHNANIRALRQTSRIGYRRMRKMLTSSRRWKVAPRLKDSERSCTKYGMKSFHRNRKRVCALERRRLEIPSKRRKLCHYGSFVAYDQQADSKSVSNSPEKGIKGDIISSRGAGTSASIRNHQKKDPNVKFSIKSFKVPELLIEVPENETVGSLKRTVMEAVKTILGSGLRVGMVVGGKKVRDDNKTLQQAGISQNGNLDTLGFTLEPSSYPVSPYVADQESSRRPASPIVELELPSALDRHDKDCRELALSPTNPIDPPSDVVNPGSRALVVVSPPNAETHHPVVVPISPKSSRSELPQRRTRRPFSVAEVEALVEAVEQLGTGRWRDVKIRAFEHADHRTYVDVKDKWKTLVHTASIAPQQRRGEPVPQELLDRVLIAHGYWSKQHAEAPKTSKGQVQNVGALENNNNNNDNYCPSTPSKIVRSAI